jgi:myo-inositol 2-dehydrogenase/D-chiro-inositol 1-dehydrogenase
MENLVDSQGFDANHQIFSFHMLEKNERWGYVQEDKRFLDAIIETAEPPVTALDGYKSIELVESVYKAIRTGERIKFG